MAEQLTQAVVFVYQARRNIQSEKHFDVDAGRWAAGPDVGLALHHCVIETQHR